MTQYLMREFGDDKVFIDIGHVKAGENFEAKIREAVGQCQMMLVVIGPDWLAFDRNTGRPRVKTDDDLVRTEIAEALAQKLIVVPILVHDAHLPAPAELPAELRELPVLNARKISVSRFFSDMQGLTKAIREVTKLEPIRDAPRRRGWLAPLTALTACAASVVAGAAAVQTGYMALPRLNKPELAETRNTENGGVVIIREVPYPVPVPGLQVGGTATGGPVPMPLPPRDPKAILKDYVDPSTPTVVRDMLADQLRGLGYRPVIRKDDDPVPIWWSPPARLLPPGAEFKDCELPCPEMVSLRPGTFEMGADGNLASERPARKQTISVPIAIGKYEVTVALYRQFLRSSGDARAWVCDVRWYNKLMPPRPADDKDEPANCVSWQDAMDFVSWLSKRTNRTYRLPTEAEWEYAARAGGSFGNELRDLCHLANGAISGSMTLASMKDGSIKDSASGALGCTPASNRLERVHDRNANPFGLHHMHGNVAEWVRDCWHDSYAGKPEDLYRQGHEPWLRQCSSNRSAMLGVVRGGDWRSPPEQLRSSARLPQPANVRSDRIGLRVVRVMER